MRASFIHFGDIHLGTLQYNSLERLRDFGIAWHYACEYAARAKPDFVICTGDLFNRFTINPITYDQAHAGLSILRQAGIPIVDIQGNHDRARYGEPHNWLQTLAKLGLLTYLDIEANAGGMSLRPVPREGHVGSYVEWAGCRIIGVRYLGTSTEKVLENLHPQLERLRDGLFTILVLHGGVAGIIPNFNAELSAQAIDQLRGLVDYVALGHIHKYYAVGSLAHNAGSLETWALNEWGWDRGLLEVTVDTDASPVVSTRLVPVPRRPFCVIKIDVDDYATPRDLLRGCQDRLLAAARQEWSARPVAVLTLHGRLRFDQTSLPVNQIEEAMHSVLDPLVASVRERYEIGEGGIIGDSEEGLLTRDVLERMVLRARLAEDERYAPHAEQLAAIAITLKDQALRGEGGGPLLETLRSGLREIPRTLVTPGESDAAAEPTARGRS